MRQYITCIALLLLPHTLVHASVYLPNTLGTQIDEDGCVIPATMAREHDVVYAGFKTTSDIQDQRITARLTTRHYVHTSDAPQVLPDGRSEQAIHYNLENSHEHQPDTFYTGDEARCYYQELRNFGAGAYSAAWEIHIPDTEVRMSDSRQWIQRFGHMAFEDFGPLRQTTWHHITFRLLNNSDKECRMLDDNNMYRTPLTFLCTEDVQPQLRISGSGVTYDACGARADDVWPQSTEPSNDIISCNKTLKENKRAGMNTEAVTEGWRIWTLTLPIYPAYLRVIGDIRIHNEISGFDTYLRYRDMPFVILSRERCGKTSLKAIERGRLSITDRIIVPFDRRDNFSETNSSGSSHNPYPTEYKRRQIEQETIDKDFFNENYRYLDDADPGCYR